MKIYKDCIVIYRPKTNKTKAYFFLSLHIPKGVRHLSDIWTVVAFLINKCIPVRWNTFCLRAWGQRDPAFLLSSTQIVWQPGKEASESQSCASAEVLYFCLESEWVQQLPLPATHQQHDTQLLSHRENSVEWSLKCKFEKCSVYYMDILNAIVERKNKVQKIIQDSSVCFIRWCECVRQVWCSQCEVTLILVLDHICESRHFHHPQNIFRPQLASLSCGHRISSAPRLLSVMYFKFNGCHDEPLQKDI